MREWSVELVAQQETKSLFAREGEGDTFKTSLIMHGRGTILLHKKLRTPDGQPMTYIVQDVYRHTEDGELMVGYQALYPTNVGEVQIGKEAVYEKHVRPLSMFTTDRFVRLGHFDHILRAMNNAL